MKSTLVANIAVWIIIALISLSLLRDFIKTEASVKKEQENRGRYDEKK